LSRPWIGRSAAFLTPPPSVSSTTSGASTSMRACRSPVAAAPEEAGYHLVPFPAVTAARGRRARRARGPVRDLAHRRPATCPRRPRSRRTGRSKTSRSTKTARSVGLRVSSTSQHRQSRRCRRARRPRRRRGGEQRLGQPRADVRLPAARDRAHPVQREPRGDPHQVGALVTHLDAVDLRPAQPGLLEHVLGVGGRAEHLVGDREQQVAVLDEGVRRAHALRGYGERQLADDRSSPGSAARPRS
jgi:hypothetical protein